MQATTAFPPTSLQISNIHAGTGAANVIPGMMVADFNLRFSTEQTAQRLTRQIEAMFASHQLECELTWALSGEPFLTATSTLIDAVSESIHEVQGIRPTASTGGGTSDGRFIARLGTEIVELGPVNTTIHSLDEHTNIDELKRLSTIYLGILKRLLATDA